MLLYNEYEWKLLNTKYSQDEILDMIINSIKNEPNNFPYPIVKETDVIQKFNKLKNLDISSSLIHKDDCEEVIGKYEYNHSWQDYGLGVISCGAYYNAISTYFQNINRYKCGGYNVKSPTEIWNECGDDLRKLLKGLWRLGRTEVNNEEYIGCIRLGSYIAASFKPQVAKTLYEMFGAKKIIDTSCGWGDRLAGFHCSDAKSYYGCDPNPDVFKVYKKQIEYYEKLLGTYSLDTSMSTDNTISICGSKNTNIYLSGSEYAPLTLNADFAFTSPPYFSTERYANDVDDEYKKNQSWVKYNEFDSWKNDFFYPTINNTDKSLIDGGYMLWNIIDPAINGKRYYLCDEMIEYIETLGYTFLGIIGMKISRRPINSNDKDKMDNHFNSHFIEPVFVFQKGNYDVVNPFDIYCKTSWNLEAFI